MAKLKIRGNDLPKSTSEPLSKKEAAAFLSGDDIHNPKPKKSAARDYKKISIRFNEYEYKELENALELADMKALEFIRDAIQDKIKATKRKSK